ncbi:MAG: hypothetical protein Q4F99_05160 [bacterium]|nr:hypothetical protein [bacterium]
MEHLTLLCTAQARQDALEALRSFGCVHVAVEVRDGEAIRHANATLNATEQALRILDIAEAKGLFAFRPDAASPVATMSIPELLTYTDICKLDNADGINRAAEAITRLREEALTLELTIRKYAPFGEIDPKTIAALAQGNVKVRLFKLAVADKAAATKAFLFAEEAGFVYGAWLLDEPLPETAELIPIPDLSTTEMGTRIETCRATADELVDRLAAAAESLRPIVTKQRAHAQEGKTFAEVAANVKSDEAIAWLTGYLPARQGEALIARAQTEGWGIVLAPPAEDDPNVPVLLEAPKGFRSIGTLFQGLGILPGYTEGDCSVPFYIFFSVFFAMLVGDAGYGAIMLLGTLLAGIKGFKKPALRPLFIILTVFCLATIGWGVLSGTYFGIAKDALPACLRDIPTVAWLNNNDNIMFLCFFIGALHISIARLWNAVLLAPSIKALGELGWLGVTWSMFMIVCGIVVSWFTQPEWTTWMLAGSIGLILVALIADIKREAINIGMLPLNVISSMGDIISYVRLFAVGLASVKVAENFNAMALDLDMGFTVKIIAMSAILLVGHGLNLAMGALSILVHAVRLNTLEFSNAKGITWSGMPYTPFKNTSQQ